MPVCGTKCEPDDGGKHSEAGWGGDTMNLLLWMVVGMIIGCTVQVIGRARDEVSILCGLLAGAAGAVVAGALATDLSGAMQWFDESISVKGLLAAVLGSAACSAVLRLLWQRRSRALNGDIGRSVGGASGGAAPGPWAGQGGAALVSTGDTEPAAFDSGHAGHAGHAKADVSRSTPRDDTQPLRGTPPAGPVHEHR